MGQGASIQESPAEQGAETSAPAVNSFTAEELLPATVWKVQTAAQKYFKVGILYITLYFPQYNFNFAIH